MVVNVLFIAKVVKSTESEMPIVKYFSTTTINACYDIAPQFQFFMFFIVRRRSQTTR